MRVTVTRTWETPGAIQTTAAFKVYPNPISKGGTLNLVFNNDNGKDKMIRIAGLDGRTVLEQKLGSHEGKNLLLLSTDARWSAGIYFVRLFYENGQLAASEKIIIQ